MKTLAFVIGLPGIVVACSILDPAGDLEGRPDAATTGGSAGSLSDASDSGGAAGVAGSAGAAGSGSSWKASFSRTYGREADQFVGEISIDAADNILLVGSFQGSIDTGYGKQQSAGLEDIFVIKLDSAGVHQWSHCYGSSGDDLATAVASDYSDGSVYATGHFSGAVNFGGGALTANTRDIFLLKLDAAGSHLWSKRFGGGSSDGGQALLPRSGQLVFAALFKGTVDFGGPTLTSAGQNDIAIVKLDQNGDYVWQQQFGGTGYDNAGCLSADAAGNLYFSGWFNVGMTIGSDVLVANGGADYFVAKLDPDGNPLWAKSIGGSGAELGPICAKTNPEGDVFVLGNFDGEVDFGGGPVTVAQDPVLIRLGTDGSFLGATPYGDAGSQSAGAIALVSTQLFIGGGYESQIDLGGDPFPQAADRDVFVALLQTSGAHLRSAGFAASGYQAVTSAVFDTQGRIWVAGQMEQSVDFGSGLLASLGGRDVFVARFDP